MAKINVRIPEPKEEYDVSNQKQINRSNPVLLPSKLVSDSKSAILLPCSFVAVLKLIQQNIGLRRVPFSNKSEKETSKLQYIFVGVNGRRNLASPVAVF